MSLPFFDENISNSTYPSETVILTGIQGTADEGKAVTLSAGSTFALASAADNFDGFIYSVDTVYPDGTIVGTVKRQPLLRKRAINAGATPLAVGDLVEAAAQVAAGTEGLPQVQSTAGTTSWRVIELLSGTGLQTEELVIEKVA